MRLASQTEGLKQNYYALYLSIICKMTVTKAIMAMGINVDSQDRVKEKPVNLSDEDCEEVIELKTLGLTWFEIADKFEIRRNALFAKIRRYMGDDWENRGWK